MVRSLVCAQPLGAMGSAAGRETGSQLDLEGFAVSAPTRFLQNQIGPSARLRLADACRALATFVNRLSAKLSRSFAVSHNAEPSGPTDLSDAGNIGAEADSIRNIHGIAEIAVLDGDELDYLVGKVAEARRIGRRLGDTAERWWSRIEKVSKGRLLEPVR
jgi:hypothetical protein